MKKLLFFMIPLLGMLLLHSCSKKDVKPDQRQEETKPDEQPKDSKNITFTTYRLEDEKGVMEFISDKETSKIYFYGKFNGEPEENLLVNAVTYQSPGGDSLYHFVLDGEYRVKRMYVTFPDGSFDTTLITLSYPHPDTTVVTSYYYNWETNQDRLYFRVKTYYKNDRLMALPGGRFSLGEFKKESLKTIIGSVAAAVGVIEVTGAVVALATTAPAWAIVGAGVAIVAFANSAMASEELIPSETPFQGSASPSTHQTPQLVSSPSEPDKGMNIGNKKIDLSGKWALDILSFNCTIKSAEEGAVENNTLTLKFNQQDHSILEWDEDGFYSTQYTFQSDENELYIHLYDKNENSGCYDGHYTQNQDGSITYEPGTPFYKFTDIIDADINMEYDYEAQIYHGTIDYSYSVSPTAPCALNGAPKVRCTGSVQLRKVK